MYRPHNIGADGIGRSSSCNSKVCYLYFAVCGNNNILRLHITMYNAVAVCCLKSHRYLNGNTGSFLYRKLTFLGNILLKSDSLDQLHYDIINTLIIAYIKYIYYVWMGKTCCCLRFTSEFLYKSCIFPEFRLQNLNCHKTVQFMVHCLIYVRHSAGTDFTYNFIAFCYNHTCL